MLKVLPNRKMGATTDHHHKQYLAGQHLIKQRSTPEKQKIFVQEDPKGIECQILRQDTCHPSGTPPS